MIIQETITINNKDYIKTSSDSGYYIERDGVLYSEAIDLPSMERVYTETNVRIEAMDSEEQYAEAGKILLGVSE